MTKFESIIKDLCEANNMPVQGTNTGAQPNTAPNQQTSTSTTAAPPNQQTSTSTTAAAPNQQKPTTTPPPPSSTTQPVNNVNFSKDGFTKFQQAFNHAGTTINSPADLKQYGLAVNVK